MKIDAAILQSLLKNIRLYVKCVFVLQRLKISMKSVDFLAFSRFFKENRKNRKIDGIKGQNIGFFKKIGNIGNIGRLAAQQTTSRALIQSSSLHCDVCYLCEWKKVYG